VPKNEKPFFFSLISFHLFFIDMHEGKSKTMQTCFPLSLSCALLAPDEGPEQPVLGSSILNILAQPSLLVLRLCTLPI